MDLQTDLQKLKTGATVVLHPNVSNPLHDKPVKALGYTVALPNRAEPWREDSFYPEDGQ